MFRGDLKPICYMPIRETLGSIAYVRLSKRQQKYSTEVHELFCTKLNIDTAASYDYMIHDGYYYSIINKDKIISLMDEIE